MERRRNEGGGTKRKVMRGGNRIRTGKYGSDFSISYENSIVVFDINGTKISIYKDLKSNENIDTYGNRVSPIETYYGYGYFENSGEYVYFSLIRTTTINEGIQSYIKSFFDCVTQICLSNNNLCLELYRQAKEQLLSKNN